MFVCFACFFLCLLFLLVFSVKTTAINVTNYATLSSAITNAGFNDTIVLSPGTYTMPTGTTFNSGGKAITIKGLYESSRSVIQCSDAPVFNFVSGESYDTLLQGLFFLYFCFFWQ
jgi:hypothetical protein